MSHRNNNRLWQLGGSGPASLLLLVAWILLLVHAVSTSHIIMHPKSLLIGKNVTLNESYHAFIHASADVVQFKISSESCGFSKKFTVNLTAQLGSEGYIADVLGLQWYLLYFHVQGKEVLRLVIEGASSPYVTSFKWPSLRSCISDKGLNFYFGRQSEVATSHSSASTIPSFPYPKGDDRFYHDLGYDRPNGNFHAFIPIGAMVLLVGVCVRCCHYCRYKSQLRKRTRTVVGAVTIEGVESATATPADPPQQYLDAPPCYEEICTSELPPPSYAEIFQSGESKTTTGQTEVVHQTAVARGGAAQENEGDPPTAQQDAEALLPISQEEDSVTMQHILQSEDPPEEDIDTSSAVLKAWTSLTHARRKSQFAFRRLQEEQGQSGTSSSLLK